MTYLERVDFPLDPVGKPRMTRRDIWKKRPAVVRYRAYCDQLRLHAPRGWVPADIHVVRFRIAMPASWSEKKRRGLYGQPHRQKPDIDNLHKALLDAFGEDKTKHAAALIKVWSDVAGITVWNCRDAEGMILALREAECS